jgi:tol-pal system protein YbgF
MQKMQEQLDYLETSQRRVEKDMMRLDSLVTESSQDARLTRADVSTTLEDFQGEVRGLRESVEDLRKSIDKRPAQIVYQSPPATTSTGTPTAPGAEGLDLRRLDSLAFLDVKKGNYELAISQFREILTYFGNSNYAPKAHYWIGESFYSMADPSDAGRLYYDSAIVSFEYLTEQYPGWERIPTALYKLGRCYEELGRSRLAKRNYERVVAEYPKSLEAKPAQSRLDELK